MQKNKHYVNLIVVMFWADKEDKREIQSDE